jgi:hypothetical protein
MVLTVAVAFVLFLLAANNPINWIYLLIVILTGIYLITYNGGKMKPAGTTSKQAFGFGVISAILREKFWFLIAVILFIILALPIFTYNINEPTSNLPTKQLTFNLGHSSITIQCIKGTISDKIIIKHDLLTCIARYYGNITADTFGPINISVHRKIPDASTFTGPFELGSETNTTEWTVATLPLNSFNSYNETQFYAKIPSSDYFNFVLILPEYYISDPNLLYASTSLDLYEQLRQSSFQRLELAGVLLGIFGAIKFLQELWEKRNSTQ